MVDRKRWSFYMCGMKNGGCRIRIEDHSASGGEGDRRVVYMSSAEGDGVVKFSYASSAIVCEVEQTVTIDIAILLCYS